MTPFYHSLSGLATPSTSGLVAYGRLPGVEAGRFLRRRHWFRWWFNDCAVCCESVSALPLLAAGGLDRLLLRYDCRDQPLYV